MDTSHHTIDLVTILRVDDLGLKRFVQFILLVTLAALSAGCAGSPIDPDRADRNVTTESFQTFRYVGILDTTSISTAIRSALNWHELYEWDAPCFIPMAILHEPFREWVNWDQSLSMDGREFAVLVVVLTRKRVVDGSDGAMTTDSLLSLVTIERDIMKESAGPWMAVTTRTPPHGVVPFPRKLHLEDVTFQIERFAEIIDYGIDHEFYDWSPRIVDRDDCIEFDETYLQNWDTLFGSRPRFAYPICD